MDAPRETPIYAAGVVGQSLFGADRALVIIVLTLTAMLAMIALVAPLWWLLALDLAFLSGSMTLLKLAYKADPLFFTKYLRAVRYAEFYPAKSGLHARTRRVPKGWL